MLVGTPAAPETVDADEAACGQRGQETAGDGSPEAPAEVGVVGAGRRRGAVLATRESAERRHSRRLHYNCNIIRNALSSLE